MLIEKNHVILLKTVVTSKRFLEICLILKGPMTEANISLTFIVLYHL